MTRTGDENRRVKRVEQAAVKLNKKTAELVVTPTTLARLGLLPHVLKRLTDIHDDRSGHEYLFCNADAVNANLKSARQRAAEAVQNLLVEVHNKLSSLESTGIQQCANLLHCFETLMTLISSNLRVSAEFQALSPQVNGVQARFVKKAITMLQDIVARAKANDPKTPWPALLRDLGDFEDLLSISPETFKSDPGIQSLLGRVATVFCPPLATSSRPAAEPVQPVHVKQVVWDLYNNPAAPYLATAASSAFGGVCSNIFRLAHPPTYERIWVNSPLPKTPNKRAIAVNWITTHLHEQASLLRAQCQVDVRPQETTDGFFKSITLHSSSDDQYFQEKHSVIHFVHLDQQKTYHLTTYREHIVHLSFDMVVLWRKLYANDAKSPPCEKVGGISLRFVASAYGIKTKGSSNQYILTREFDGDAEYCEIATSITEDEDEVKCPKLVGLKREWTNWVIITKVDDSSTSVVQMSVTMGLQHSKCEFVPYDNVVREEDCAGPSAAFEVLAKHWKQRCAEDFEKDGDRWIKGLKEVMRYQLVDQAPIVAADHDDDELAQQASDEMFDELVEYIACSEERGGTSETGSNDSATDASDTDIAPTSVATTNDAMADHRSLNSAGARATPIRGQTSKRKRDDTAEVETATQEFRRAVTTVRERYASLFRSFPPAFNAFYHLREHFLEHPKLVVAFLMHVEYEDPDTVREWVEKLLNDTVIEWRRSRGE